jgi:hypothetical protein
MTVSGLESRNEYEPASFSGGKRKTKRRSGKSRKNRTRRYGGKKTKKASVKTTSMPAMTTAAILDDSGPSQGIDM